MQPLTPSTVDIPHPLHGEYHVIPQPHAALHSIPSTVNMPGWWGETSAACNRLHRTAKMCHSSQLQPVTKDEGEANTVKSLLLELLST